MDLKTIYQLANCSSNYETFKSWVDSEFNETPVTVVDETKYTLVKSDLRHSVSQQRELLLAYENYTSEMIIGKTNDRTAKSLVDGFLANNCG